MKNDRTRIPSTRKNTQRDAGVSFTASHPPPAAYIVGGSVGGRVLVSQILIVMIAAIAVTIFAERRNIQPPLL